VVPLVEGARAKVAGMETAEGPREGVAVTAVVMMVEGS
jgi:hypothetical protein